MKTFVWQSDVEPVGQLADLIHLASEPGLLVVEVHGGSSGKFLSWDQIERWSRSRAVTASVVTGDLRGPGLDVGLLCDLVFVHADATVSFGRLGQPPSPGMVHALGRAGRPALIRGLLDDEPVTADEAVRLGLAHEVVTGIDRLPLPSPSSLTALTAARDLMRSPGSGEAGRALELATFRLLFASGDPEEGARAFLERREPRFPTGELDRDPDP